MQPNTPTPKKLKTKNMTTSQLRNSVNWSPLRRAFFLIPLALACFALSPTARAVDPPPDGGYPNENTAEGEDALFSLTTGVNNTAVGFEALFSNATANNNTAIGANALFSNTTGSQDTAVGVEALFHNTLGGVNTAIGFEALFSNTTAIWNTAIGSSALFRNTTGDANTATGTFALSSNTGGNFNTAVGHNVLSNNKTGASNIVLGFQAGLNLKNGSDNIYIANAGGTSSESATIRIGTTDVQTATFIAGINGVTVPNGVGVIVGIDGKLGTVVSSERYKDSIKPMDQASEAILSLQPVTFRYKHELDPEGIPQFGLVAEQVEKVNPDLVARDAQGKPYTVRYEAVNAMLLNEFLKEHRKVEEQGATTAQLKQDFQSKLAEQQKQIKALTASLKEQAS